MIRLWARSRCLLDATIEAWWCGLPLLVARVTARPEAGAVGAVGDDAELPAAGVGAASRTHSRLSLPNSSGVNTTKGSAERRLTLIAADCGGLQSPAGKPRPRAGSR